MIAFMQHFCSYVTGDFNFSMFITGWVIFGDLIVMYACYVCFRYYNTCMLYYMYAILYYITCILSYIVYYVM